MVRFVAVEFPYSSSSSTVTEDVLPTKVSTAAYRGWDRDTGAVTFEVLLEVLLVVPLKGTGDPCISPAGGTSAPNNSTSGGVRSTRGAGTDGNDPQQLLKGDAA
jgi:hypothetical protein